MANNESEIVARKRWKLLVDVIVKKKPKTDETSDISVRRFGSFGLIKTTLSSQTENNCTHSWYDYTSHDFPELKAPLRHLGSGLRLGDLLGFNNTGNVCVWPSEEILTYHCLKRKETFKNKAICEIGGGMTCLAGIALAVCSDAKEMCLTDGNSKSVENVDVIIAKNGPSLKDTNVYARVLKWDEHRKLGDLKGRFDIIICGDCYFFDECREDLLQTFNKLLKPKGEVISFAPSRGRTFYKFEKIATKLFDVETLEKYDDKVWNLHNQNKAKEDGIYDPNIHYPLYMHLVKKT